MTTTAPPRPKALPVIFKSIPSERQRIPQWVVWKYEWRDSDDPWTKPPYQTDCTYAASTAPATWTTFERAKAAFEAGGWDEIGFVPNVGDNLTAVDWDKVRDVDDGTIEARAAAEVNRLDTYTEDSPSARGLRAFAFGKKPGRKAKKGNFELYDGITADGKQGGRYLTVTGHQLDGSPDTINERQEVINALYRERFDAPKPERNHASNGKASGGSHWQQRTSWVVPVGPLSDADVLKLVEYGYDEKLTALYRGDTSGHGGDDSVADAALLEKLAWWIGGLYEDRLDRLFRGSGLYRSKWDRDDYRGRTFDFLAQKMTEFRQRTNSTTTPPNDTSNPPPGRDWSKLIIDSPTLSAATPGNPGS